MDENEGLEQQRRIMGQYNVAVGAMAPQRDKLWAERTTDEKLDALRQHLVETIWRMDGITERIQNLSVHTHSNAQIVVPLCEHPRIVTNSTPTGLRDKE